MHHSNSRRSDEADRAAERLSWRPHQAAGGPQNHTELPIKSLPKSIELLSEVLDGRQQFAELHKSRHDGDVDLDRDLGVYLELARSYQRRKKFARNAPQ